MDQLFEKGDKASANFTGDAYVKMLVTDDRKIFDCTAYDVQFCKGSRNFWHIHKGGQLLFVTAGEGFYQEKGKQAQLLKKGDVVQIPPDVEHWHGATANSDFTHIGISTQMSKGDPIWCNEVTDIEYTEANSSCL